MDFNECACSGKTLARLLRPAIMAVLAKGPAHGYQLAHDLRQMKMFTCQEADPTGIYRMLKQMEDEKLLTSRWDLIDSGPAKRVFAMTKAGMACMNQWRQTLVDYREAVDELLGMLTSKR